MSYREDHDAQQVRLQQAQQAASDAQALFQLFERHREILNCQANTGILTSYFAGEPMSLETLEEAIANPALQKQLAYTSEEATRLKLMENIMAAYIGSDEARKTFAAKLRYDDIPALEKKLADIETRAEISKLPTPEIRRLANSRPAPGRAELPASYTRASLLALDGKSLRALIERHGASSITARLNQR